MLFAPLIVADISFLSCYVAQKYIYLNLLLNCSSLLKDHLDKEWTVAEASLLLHLLRVFNKFRAEEKAELAHLKDGYFWSTGESHSKVELYPAF